MRANGKQDHTIQLLPGTVAWLRLWSKRTGLTQGGLVDKLVLAFMRRNLVQLPKPAKARRA